IICGEGPEKEKLMLQAKDCKNIKFVNYNISKKELLDLYSRCLATIYIPKDEDFGFIPVESMASGKPCIGANEGGLKETIIHGKTGFLINPTVNNLIKTIKHLTPEKAEKMKKDCIKRAKEFDISVFYKKWETYLKTIGD
ncbi:MAG: glycosyltransferase, partial [Candidatus Aenigmatarchaeota archaeon]